MCESNRALAMHPCACVRACARANARRAKRELTGKIKVNADKHERNAVQGRKQEIKAQFKDEDGTGTREGILDPGQACTFEFVRQHTDTPEQ